MLKLHIITYLTTITFLRFIIKKTFKNKITTESFKHMLLYINTVPWLRFVFYSLSLNLISIPLIFIFYAKFYYVVHMVDFIGMGIFGLIYLYFQLLLNSLGLLFYIEELYLKDTKLDYKYIKLRNERFTYFEIFAYCCLVLISHRDFLILLVGIILYIYL